MEIASRRMARGAGVGPGMKVLVVYGIIRHREATWKKRTSRFFFVWRDLGGWGLSADRPRRLDPLHLARRAQLPTKAAAEWAARCGSG